MTPPAEKGPPGEYYGYTVPPGYDVSLYDPAGALVTRALLPTLLPGKTVVEEDGVAWEVQEPWTVEMHEVRSPQHRRGDPLRARALVVRRG